MPVTITDRNTRSNLYLRESLIGLSTYRITAEKLWTLFSFGLVAL